MKTFIEYLQEEVRKNQWTHLSSHDKEDYHQNLIKIVDNAYKHTTLGSFVKHVSDVQGSDWEVLDYDPQKDIDVAIFFRKARSNEHWKGNKIQGIGYKNAPESKEKLMAQVTKLLGSKGWWIEASDAMAGALRKRNVYIEKDREKLKKVFPSITSFNSDGSYNRTVNGVTRTEFIFGHVEV